MKLFYYTLRISLIVCYVFAQLVTAQETVNANKKSLPEISNIEPKEITPGMALKIEGYRLRINESSKVKVIFLQNANELITNANGGSWETANLSNGLQELNVFVPEEVLPGKYQIIIVYDEQKSLPFTVEVLPLAKPPKLVSISPSIAIPGEHIWIDGIGFNVSDTIELLDINGKKHSLKLDITSSAETSAFVLGDEIPDGQVEFKVIENRSGLSQASNSLTFKVKRTAVPLHILPEDLESVAVGQWFEVVYTGDKALDKAAKIEFLLRQGIQEQTSFVKDFKNIIVQIPKSFTAGKIEIQNRVWRNKEVSEWSKPIEYEVAESPVKPKVWSFLNIPLRAEAMFKQNGSVIAILPVTFGFNPEAPISGKIKDGQLEIFTRFWKGGKFTDWKFDRKFDFQKSEFLQKSFEFGNFNEHFYIGNDSPEFFSINRDENLQINGDYFLGSADELQVILENEGQKVVLKPSTQISLTQMLIRIPRNISIGDWNISIINTSKQVVTEIPVKLRIN
ncbi:MAG TPA: DUF4469 domain-containing protein [Pyrinomonadaceae bacterium]|nr:DUF4469 domain-containing protein [Pyrinomonadaceae bacterium]